MRIAEHPEGTRMRIALSVVVPLPEPVLNGTWCAEMARCWRLLDCQGVQVLRMSGTRVIMEKR